MKQIIAIVSSLLLVAGCSTSPETRHPAASGKTKTIRISSIKQFLQVVDLERVYVSDDDGGAPGFFLAIPKVGKKIGDEAGAKTKIDAIGYYFKGYTGLSASGKFNNKAEASPGSTGGTWNCINETKASIAEIDVAAFNPKAVAAIKGSGKKAAIAKLTAMGIGFRYTTLDKAGKGGIQSGCIPRGTTDWKPFMAAPYGEGEREYVQTYAIWHNYKKGDEKKRKADAIDVFGPSFGGHFVWEISNGKVTNANMLIELYEDAGYKYIKYD